MPGEKGQQTGSDRHDLVATPIYHLIRDIDTLRTTIDRCIHRTRLLELTAREPLKGILGFFFGAVPRQKRKEFDRKRGILADQLDEIPCEIAGLKKRCRGCDVTRWFDKLYVNTAGHVVQRYALYRQLLERKIDSLEDSYSIFLTNFDSALRDAPAKKWVLSNNSANRS
jgi:hypothetical protein